MGSQEEALPGGFVTTVVRVGETVRRQPPRGAEFVHRLLDHLAAHDWPGAPRFLGFDADGREMLSYVDGQVPWDRPPEPTDAALAAVARLVREFHDLTAGTALAGDAEVVCHNDLSPKNTVYRPGPIAFIDWDLAAPGARVHDVAHVCWQFTALGPGADVAEAGRRVRVVCDSYGLADRTDVIDTVLWWQDRCWRGIEEQAAAGDPAMVRLRDGGQLKGVRDAYEWTATHRADLERAVG
ncbi:phosphotransferase [Asanoa sp. WMMD1127]|uniref:phosphotransferase n=1 Tax=Asanoa sp. WMMD1127 TaxID=3016107 RepID=UPI002416FE0E|nr:phosphotransferase [Asanoa sp. WMMD1127]MDG4825408.1 phosphotransferase [Asanoa sp. WMMD1127]